MSLQRVLSRGSTDQAVHGGKLFFFHADQISQPDVSYSLILLRDVQTVCRGNSVQVIMESMCLRYCR